jgi:endonuclease YncB( thermonuclease family)
MTGRLQQLALSCALMIVPLQSSFAANVEVIDGGTLRVRGKIVRLWGIAVPGKDEVCTTSKGEVWPCGQRSLAQVREIIQQEGVSCETKEQGAVCRVAGLDLAALLVKEGLARSMHGYDALEQNARAARAGLWE